MRTNRRLTLFAFVLLALPSAARPQAPQPKVTPIASLPGIDPDEVTRMPNGRVLIYGVGDSIMAYDVSTKRSALVTRGWDYCLVVSPQGDRIAYAHVLDEGSSDAVWTIPVDPATGKATGKAQRVSLSAGDVPSFSPDGKTIAFAVDRPNRRQDLAVVPVTGGPEKILASYDRSIRGTSWSEDGRWVFAFVGGNGDTLRTIQRVPLVGGPSEVLLRFPAVGRVEGAVNGRVAFWREDDRAQDAGRLSYFAAGGTIQHVIIPRGMLTEIYGITAAHSIVNRTLRPESYQMLDVATGTVRPLFDAGVDGSTLRWSPDARRVVVEWGIPGRLNLTVMNVDGSGRRNYAVPHLWGGLQWSPDGSMIAVHTDSGRTVALVNLESGTVRDLIKDKRPILSLAWRSDSKALLNGRNIAPASAQKDHLVVFEKRLDGTERTVRDVSAEFPLARTVGPLADAQMLVINPRQTPGTFALVPLGTGASRAFTVRPADAGETVNITGRSLDGRWIIAMGAKGGRVVSLYRVSAVTGAVQSVRLPFDGVNGGHVTLPDSAHVYFAGRTPGDPRYKFFDVPLNGGTPRLMATVNGDLRRHQQFASPDGRMLAFTSFGTPTYEVAELDVTPILRSIKP